MKITTLIEEWIAVRDKKHSSVFLSEVCSQKGWNIKDCARVLLKFEEKAQSQGLLNPPIQPQAKIVVKAPTGVASAASLATADLSQIGRNKYGEISHIIIVGDPRIGKSTLARYLASLAEGPIEIIDPHYENGDWPGLPVYGCERNFNQIAQLMQAQLDELNQCYSLRAKGEFKGDRLTTICDEYAAVAANEATRKISKTWVQAIACEGGKVGRQIILIAHGENGDLLNFEGRTELKNAFQILRLGKFAVSHCKRLKDDAALAWLESQHRPAMLDDLPFGIPEIEIELPPGEISRPKLRSFAPSTSNLQSDKPAQKSDKGLIMLARACRKLKALEVSDTEIIEEILNLGGRNFKDGKRLLEELLKIE